MSQNERPFSNHVRLWCQGYNLTIRPTGEILGTDNDSDPDSKYFLKLVLFKHNLILVYYTSIAVKSIAVRQISYVLYFAYNRNEYINILK